MLLAICKLEHQAKGSDQGVDSLSVWVYVSKRIVCFLQDGLGVSEFLCGLADPFCSFGRGVAADRDKADDALGILERIDVFKNTGVAKTAKRQVLFFELDQNLFLLQQTPFVSRFGGFDGRLSSKCNTKKCFKRRKPSQTFLRS